MKTYSTLKASAFVVFAAFSLQFASCKKDPVKDPDAGSPGVPTDPVETSPPNARYSPAFSGQTRIAGLKTTTAVKSNVISTSLSSPWGIAAMPDGRLLITEKQGRMRIATAAGMLSEPITGLPAVNAAGQGGLLGLCLDPDFSSNRMVYWVFSEPGNMTAVAKGKLAENERSFESVTVIFRATPAYQGTNHYGGRVIFDKNGYLFVSTGERSDNSIRVQAQQVSSGLGKVVRITKNGQAAPGNPFAGRAGALPELYSIGHRNPQGLALHPETGDIWQSEHGPRGGDELNRIQAGANFGWPVITYGIEYSGQPVGDGIQQQEGMTQPVYYWDPVISPSGMTFYSGDRVPEWKNDLFIGALSGTHIARLAIRDNKVIGEERLLASEGQRFRDVTQGTDGALYAITDGGRLYRIDREQ